MSNNSSVLVTLCKEAYSLCESVQLLILKSNLRTKNNVVLLIPATAVIVPNSCWDESIEKNVRDLRPKKELLLSVTPITYIT